MPIINVYRKSRGPRPRFRDTTWGSYLLLAAFRCLIRSRL